MLWLIVQDRESEKWYLIREMSWETYKKYDIRTNRSKKDAKTNDICYSQPRGYKLFY